MVPSLTEATCSIFETIPDTYTVSVFGDQTCVGNIMWEVTPGAPADVVIEGLEVSVSVATNKHLKVHLRDEYGNVVVHAITAHLQTDEAYTMNGRWTKNHSDNSDVYELTVSCKRAGTYPLVITAGDLSYVTDITFTHSQIDFGNCSTTAPIGYIVTQTARVEAYEIKLQDVYNNAVVCGDDGDDSHD